MAAVTSVVVAAGGLALSGMQYIKQRQDMNEAEEAASQAAQNFLATKTENKLKGLQVPKLGTELAQQAKDRGVKQTMDVLQQQGPEGAFQVTDIVDASNTQDLKIAANIQDEEAKLNKLIATQDQEIETQRTQDIKDLEAARLEGAGLARKQALEGSQQAASDFASGVGGLGTSLYAQQDLYNPDGSQIIV